MERKSFNWRSALRPRGYYAKRPGSLVKVKHCPNGYRLPPGLEPGDVVRIAGFDHGFYTVEKNGRKFDIFLVNVVQ
jgi:hypothetical protein